MKYLRGLREVEKTLQRKLKHIDTATTEGLVKAGDYLLELSQPLVPVDTGRLKDSGNVAQNGPNRVFVHYEARDPVTGYDYAPIVHENLAYHHPIHYGGAGEGHEGRYDCGGQAKFLEQPFRENITELVNIIANNIRKGVDQ